VTTTAAPPPRVAIAVPSLDQGRFLGEALDSVFAQTGVDVRVAVLDAGSRDDSPAVIRRYESRLAYWRSRPDAGQAAAINEGIAQLAETRHVTWLNADDVLLPGALARMAAYLDAHPDRVAVFGEAYIIDAAGHTIGRFPTRPFSRRALARTSIICQPASLISRRAWEAVGGLDESLHICLDYDLWWRLSKLGPIGFFPEPIACSRDHEATKTRGGQDRLYREAFGVLIRHLGYVPWPWCLHESAYAWRAAHGGRRAADPLSRLACVWRAATRYARTNGPSGMISALRGSG
jgi:GT2 family glycosyltransferase